MTDDLVAGLNIPDLPEGIPQRLEEALLARIEALLFQLRQAKQERFIKPLEIRLIRDAHRAVLTAVELGLHDAKVHYATFRHLLEELDYVRTDVGFSKENPTDPD